MRYFVYHDNRILGPVSVEDLQGLGGVEPDALVCPEDASGRRDEDWKSAREVAELTGGLRSPLTTVVADDTFSGGDGGLLERLELESLGVPRDGDGEDWLAGFFNDAEFRTRWGSVLPKSEDAPENLSTAQNRIRELSDQLKSFQQRIKELEAQQRDLLSQMRGNAQTGKLEPMRPASLQKPSTPPPAVAAPPPPRVEPPAPDPAVPELPSFGLRREEPVAPFAEPELPAAAPPTERAPETEFQKRAFKFTPPKPQAETPKTGLPKFGAAKTFRVVKKEDPSATAPGTPVYEWNVSSKPPAAGLPEAKKIEPLAPPPPTIAPTPAGPSFELPQPRLPSAAAAPPPTLPASQPPPISLSPANPLPPPPMTMQFAAPAQPAAPAPAMPSFAPAPTPQLTPLTPDSAPPATGNYMGPSVGSGPVLTPSRSNSEPLSAAQTPASDVMKRLARPEAPKTVEKPKERNSKVFYIASGALVLVLLASFAFFLRSPKDLKNMMNMGGDHKPLGVATEDADIKNQVFKPKAPEASAPTAAPQTPAPAQQQAAPVAAPTPAPTPAPAPAPAVDQGETAKQLVMNYPLDADRGSVAQRLSFMFTADAESGNKEEWTAGAVEANIFIVQYRVIPGTNSKSKEVISYLFEANLAHGTVKGNNPAARELLGGPTAPPKPKKQPRPAPKRRVAAAVKRAPAPPKEVPLIPLPSDTDLLPPAEGDSQFKSDTVH